ncbi:MAG: methicillin resistance protein [Anaerolineae bacterium]|nr:peptidoglycan bridge formation glycyltransferase FemA/FemB family protein [Anaerolineales bacterium]MCQ3976134.1 methicillin resistance protein [Anaerolineae bacterium]
MGQQKMTNPLPLQPSNLPTFQLSTDWDARLLSQHGHLLQSWAWGDLKSRFDWSAVRVQTLAGDAAQILFRRLPLGLTLAYIPKGPLVDWTNSEQCRALFALIHAEAKKRRAILLKVEPDVCANDPHPQPLSPGGRGVGGEGHPALHFLQTSGFRPADSIQPRTSLVIDLSGDEAAILAAMKQKTRYNIRLAEKKGVVVRMGNAADVATFYQLALVTAARDGFGVHSIDYYQAAYSLFAPHRCALLIAEFQGQPLAALLVFSFGQEAYYFYGASANEHRNLMAPYLLQWEAMRWAKNQGCLRYDLWGIPDADPTTLEAEFEQRHEGLWGVYRFKRGFGGQWAQSIGAFDYVYNPLLYQIYKWRRSARLT